jgi:hypothetical protein
MTTTAVTIEPHPARWCALCLESWRGDMIALRVGAMLICDACAERVYITAQNERQKREGNRP